MSATRFLADRVWDGIGPLRGRSAVDVVDGSILDVGDLDQLAPLTADAIVCDLGDVTLLPGLIDTHVHVTFSATDDVVADFECEKQIDGGGALLARARHNLGVAVDAGITTVRDLGTPAVIANVVRRELSVGTMRGPSFVTSASPLTTPGGHCHFLSHEVGPEEDPVAAVDRAVEAGADLIKVFASGGFLTPGSSPLTRQFDREALAAIVGAAHRRGLLIAAHAVGMDSVIDCAAVGVDTIEHCGFMTPTGPVLDTEAVARMVDDGVIAVPTLGSGPPPPGAFDPETLPPAIREKIEMLMRMFPLTVDTVKAMLDAGVQLTAGTDAGIPHRPFDSLTGAIAWFGAADGLGMSAAEALATATTIAARACGLEDRGSIRRGLRADLVAVRGNPLADLGALLHPAAVFMAGQQVAGDVLATTIVQSNRQGERLR